MANCNCSNCGSNNIKFYRESLGSSRSGGRTGTRIAGVYIGSSGSTINRVHRTVALCQDCGNTWELAQPKQKSLFGQICLWLFFFPIMASIWFVNNEDIKLNKTLKIIIAVVFWFIISSTSSTAQ